MKNFGKFIKRSEPAASEAAKTPKTKNLLLQTYFTSLLCMVLCVTMFLGTSYAWFTSEVQNTENQIYAGTLDVGLYKQDGTDLATSTANTAKLFDSSIRWEPGYTALETIIVTNEGNNGGLDFKFELRFTDGTLDNNGSLKDVAKHFDVWVYPHNGGNGPTVTSYSNILTDNKWTNVGTLAEVLAGKPILSNQILKVNRDGSDNPAASTYTIALHMKETADSSVMGRMIKLNVQLIAYQMASETDDLSATATFDAVTPASSLAELAAALENNDDIVLISNIGIHDAEDVLTMASGVLDGAKNTLSYSGLSVDGNPVPVLTTSGGAISNMTVSGSANGCALYIGVLNSDLFVTDCVLSGAYAFNMGANVTQHTLTFVDTRFESPVAYTNSAKHVYFTGCKFTDKAVLKPSGDTTFTGCTFDAATLDLSDLQSGETVTLINCTYQGRTIERCILKATGGSVTVDGTDAIVVNAEKKVVLKQN